jgi:hypothetical protein
MTFDAPLATATESLTAIGARFGTVSVTVTVAVSVPPRPSLML